MLPSGGFVGAFLFLAHYHVVIVVSVILLAFLEWRNAVWFLNDLAQVS
jgi:hypothetical protein